MVKRVLKGLVIAAVILFILVFFITGGIGKAAAVARQFGDPVTHLWSGAYFTLPWQVPVPQGPDITPLIDSAQAQQPGTSDGTSDSQTFGNPSPYQGSLSVDARGASASDPKTEYVVIENTGSQPIDLTGFSLQSLQSGVRAYIPRAAEVFQSGAINAQTDVDLEPGQVAIVTSSVSPVGTSFRENECSGYLGQLQYFSPPLSTSCPDPSNEVALAESYGPTCAAYVSSMSSCTFPQDLPDTLSLGCKEFLQDEFSYNGCVSEHASDAGFVSNTWRLYIGSPRELWKNDSDTIRLLDDHGQIVAVTSY